MTALQDASDTGTYSNPVYAANLNDFSDTASFGFNEDEFRWIIQRLVDIYRRNHYDFSDFDDSTIAGLKYWLPNQSFE